MAAEIYLRKRSGVLAPVDGAGEEFIAGLSPGELVRATFKKSRDHAHHNKFFGILRLAFQNQDQYLSLEGLRFAVMIQAGYVDEIRLTGDKVAYKPQSLAFDKMDQHDFQIFYAAALQAIGQLIPSLSDIDLERELQS